MLNFIDTFARGSISPVDKISSALCAEKSFKPEPEVTGIVGIKEELFDEPMKGSLVKKGRIMTTFSPVQIIGVYGAFYSYSDDKDRISQGGKHYIVEMEGVNNRLKIPASKIIIHHDH